MTGTDAGEAVAEVDVSVVVASRDRSALLQRLLAVVLREQLPLEVVAVDDGSTDDTTAALTRLAQQDPRVVPVRTEGIGQRAATLRGVRAARGRVVVFLDDDVLPSAGLVAGHLAHHRDRDDLVVLGFMPTAVPEPWQPGAAATWLYAESYLARCHSWERHPYGVLHHLWMGNVSMTRSAYLDVVGTAAAVFPHRHDDREIGLLCLRAGMVGVFDRELRADHSHGRTLEQYVRDCRSEGAGTATIRMRHPDLVPATPAPCCRTGRPWRLAAVLRLPLRLLERPWALAPLSRAAQRLVRLGAWSRSRQLEVAAARVLRHVEHRRGEQEVRAAVEVAVPRQRAGRPDRSGSRVA